jgi:hypothetical protein
MSYLQYYIRKGLKLINIYRVLEFSQSYWLEEFIDFNTQLRIEASKRGDDFGVSLYKLMNNAVFGKTMENVRDRVSIKLYTDKKLVQKQIAKPQFVDSKILLLLYI